MPLIDKWDFVLDAQSAPAGIYVAWGDAIRRQAHDRFVPDNVKAYLAPQMKRIIDWVAYPGSKFGSDPVKTEWVFETYV